MESTLPFLIVPRHHIGAFYNPRALLVFAYIFTARSRFTDWFWGTKEQIGAATGLARTTVGDALRDLYYEEILSEPKTLTADDDPIELGATKECPVGTAFYKVYPDAERALWHEKPERLSKAPAWLIALPNRTLSAPAKEVAFLLGGLEDALRESWRGIGAKKAVEALQPDPFATSENPRQYFRNLKKLSDAGAFERIERRHRHATCFRLSYNGPSEARLSRDDTQAG